MSCELPAEFTERPRDKWRFRDSPLREATPDAAQSVLRAIFDSSSDGMLLLDSGGVVLSSNEAFAALWGARAADLAGGHWLSFCSRAGAAFPCELIYASLADGQPRTERVRLGDADGGERCVELRAIPLVLEGQPLGRLMVQAQNITPLIHLEERLADAERYTASRYLAASVAHEVKSPLQAIESCLHLAGRLSDSEQRGRYLRLARDEIQRVAQIMEQLLDLYRPVDGVRGPIALNDLVERALLLVGTTLAHSGIQVRRELAEALPATLGRADELTQVLLNLILNAMQAMRRGGLLTVSTRHERAEEHAPCLVLTVSDNGPGIEAKDLGHIFEPFFTTRAEGSGLGLAVSQRIVLAHGGTIGASSTPGEGASFRVTLPLKGAKAEG